MILLLKQYDSLSFINICGYTSQMQFSKTLLYQSQLLLNGRFFKKIRRRKYDATGQLNEKMCLLSKLMTTINVINELFS